MSAVPSAIEAALQKVDEPSDEELLIRAGWTSGLRIRPSAQLANSIYYNGQYMSVKAAQEAEKRDAVNRIRAAWRKNRQAEETARNEAARHAQEQVEFEAGAIQHEARQTLRLAVQAYSEALPLLKTAEEQLAAARKEYDDALTAKELSVEQRSAALGRSGDLIPALEIHVQHAREKVTQLLEALRSACQGAKREFGWLHARERARRVAAAEEQAQKFFALNRSDLEHVANRAWPVVNFDAACGVSTGYHWRHDYVAAKDLTATQLLEIAADVEKRFHDLEAELEGLKPQT